MSLRILHILDHSIPLHSGYTFRTLSILREQRRLGWDTFQLTGPRQGQTQQLSETVDGWHFYRTPSSSSTRWPGITELRDMHQLERRLQQVAQRLRPDVLHAHSPVLNALPALRVGQRLGIAVVYEVRAFWEDAAVDHGTTTAHSWRYGLTRWLETQALQRARHVFTICEGLRGDMLARGIASTQVTVIPNAVDLDLFSPGAPCDVALKAEWGWQDARVIGFIGSFYAYEGLDLLLDALPDILARCPDVRVLLVGGGPQEAALQAQAQRLGVADKVRFTGRVPHAQVQRYYNAVDVLVYARHPMRLTELVTPLKPLEAMAQGRLLVASDVGGHRELIRHGETGVLFQAGNAPALAASVIELLQTPQRWPALRQAGRHFVETERNWPSSVARYAPIYHALGQAA